MGRWLSDPLFLLCLTAGLLAFVVQSGELGTADTMHRLQTTHWLWTSQPQVFPNEYPEFGLHGRDGQDLQLVRHWPIAADAARRSDRHLDRALDIFSGYEDDPAVRSILVSYSTNILINVLTALIAFRFLRQLRFEVQESVGGVLALLFCTTHLHYTQNMQENNYIMLLTLVGFSYQYEWLRNGSRRALWIGSAALGLNLLTRVTTGLDVIAAGFFLLTGALVRTSARPRNCGQRAIALLQGCGAGLHFLRDCRALLQLLSLRIVDPDVHSDLCARTAHARSHPAREFPLEHAASRRRSRRTVQAGEVDFSCSIRCWCWRWLLFVMLWKRLAPEVRAYAVSVPASACRLYVLLRPLHILGGRFRLG